MKQTMQEFATGDTTTSTTGISDVQGKYWIQQILEAAKKKMFFEQFAYVTNVRPGNKDVEVPIATSNLTFTATTSEGVDRTMTQIDNLSTVTFTPSTQKFGAAISKDVVRTSQVDVVRFAREQMVYYAALTIDTAFATAIEAASSPAATLFGGDATLTSNLESGDVLTTDLIAKSIRYLKSNGWYPEPDRPFVLFLSAANEEALLKDSQFVNAAEYGGREVVMNGEIGRYLGVKVISTEQCPAHTNWGSGSLAGHSCFMVKSRVSYGIAYGEQPSLDFEYHKNQAEFRVYLDMAFQCKTLQENAIVLIKVSDA
jgi:N4-gp56 family major capsid protein